MGPGFIDVFENISSNTVKRVFEAFDEAPEELRNLVNMLADKGREYWQLEAMEKSPWGSKYASAIKVEYMGNTDFARIYVDGSETDPQSGKPLDMFVNMVEGGVRSWSIKDALLKSSKVRRSAKGLKFIVIPFRWRTPDKQKPSPQFSGVMPKDIYEIVKHGGQLGPEAGSMKGLQRYDNDQGLHGQFHTFRVVSEKSSGWQHPGHKETPVFERVKEYIGKMIEEQINKYLEDKITAIKRDTAHSQNMRAGL